MGVKVLEGLLRSIVEHEIPEVIYSPSKISRFSGYQQKY